MDDSPYIFHLNSEEVYQLDDAVILGRGGNCALVLDDDRVSREHAQFIIENGLVFIVDLGGKNTTLVNKAEIVSREKIPLAEGDLIQIGDQFFIFNAEEAPSHLSNRTEASCKVGAYYEDVSGSYKSFRSNPKKKLPKESKTIDRVAHSANKDTLRRGAKQLNKEIEKADKKIIFRDQLKEKLAESEKLFEKYEKKGLNIKDDSELLEMMAEKDKIELQLNSLLIHLETMQRQVKLYEEYKETRDGHQQLVDKVQKLEDQELTACRKGLIQDRAQIQTKYENYEKEEKQREWREKMAVKKKEQDIKEKMEALQSELEGLKKAS
ncbi:MAG: FHA domain-containing protein [Halobacteriovoraceae bacterium]|nr:FHA domain-containing protein [Halobacteriovoraceae bacterium]MBT5093476.1 FHA domain-containing protein [Halobacteriovoraceae bacterium]